MGFKIYDETIKTGNQHCALEALRANEERTRSDH